MKNIIYIILIGGFTLSCSKDNDAECIDESNINSNTACPEIYAPVCGCDEITYENLCTAESHGVISWSEGACN